MLKPTQDKEAREQVRLTMPPVQCEGCYLHKPSTYTRKDCVTYDKRECAYETIYIDNILGTFEKLGYHKGLPSIIEEALNSGNGSYKP